VTALNCIISHNGYGISAQNDSNVQISNSEITNNGAFGIRNKGSIVVDAENNWWGHETGPLDDSDDTATGGSYNPSGLGNKVSDNVDYQPWLTSPPDLTQQEPTLLDLVDGVSQVISPGVPGPVQPEVADWVPIVAGDEDVACGGDTSGPKTFVMARDYGDGRVAIMGHDGLIENTHLLDNERLMLNIISWLDATGGKKVMLSSGHSEWVSASEINPLITELESRGYSFEVAPAPITSSVLADGDVLIFANAWGTISPSEIDAVESFVANGGGLLLIGLGWSWVPYHPGTTIEDYPMMKLAAPYGVRWLECSLWDIGNDQTPIFDVFYPDTISCEVELVALEVTQAIQDWENSVTLIENKETWVRAFVQAKGSAYVPLILNLRGLRNGSELPGSPLSIGKAAKPEGTLQRNQWADSFNFELPDSWLHGTIELRASEVEIADCIECSEPAEAGGVPSDCRVRVTFNTENDLGVRFVSVRWNDGTDTYQPSGVDVVELARRLTAIYPLSEDGLDWDMGLLDYGLGPPDVDILLSRLERMREADGSDRLYYGVLTASPLVGWTGKANGIPGTVACGEMPNSDYVKGRNRHAHEIGHLLGRHHAVDETVWLALPPYRVGACGESASFWAPDFPYIAEFEGLERARIGPMDQGDNSLIYGLDTSRSPEYAVSPVQHFELMSYCGGGYRWISDFTYEGLYDAVGSISAASSGIPSTQSGQTTQEYTLITGLVDLSNNTVSFMPFVNMSKVTDLQIRQGGNYTLQLLDQQDCVLSEVSFQPNEHVWDSPGDGTPVGSFAIPIPLNPAAVEVRVLHNGIVVGTANASLNPPQVLVQYPNGGEELGGERVTLQWIGNDPDGDPLTYLVQYSSDGGSTWQTLAIDWPEQSLSVDLQSLAGTDSAFIRVTACDGFLSAADESDGSFSVPNGAPEVSIISPSNGETFSGNIIVSFDGVAIDREEGQLSGTELVWISDRDGFLGTSPNLDIKTTDLSEGLHAITFVGSDSEGLSDSDSVTIGIIRQTEIMSEPPIAFAGGPYFGTEGSAVCFNGSASYDPDGTIVMYAWDCNDDGEFDLVSASSLEHYTYNDDYAGNITLRVTDNDGRISTDTAPVTVSNVAPPVTYNIGAQDVQYSDSITPVTFNATDVANDSMTASTSWSVDGSGFTDGLPDFLALTDNGCSVSDGTNNCSWTLEGIGCVPAGVYAVLVTVEDDDGGQTVADTTINVAPEDATAAFDTDNEVAVPVGSPGGDSDLVSLTVHITETMPDLPDGAGASGNISLADVSMSLVPLEPGQSAAPVTCMASVAGAGYDGVFTLTCDFDDVPVNTYTVEVSIGGGYYTGHAEDVLVVYDPSLGFATGGGWFYWPDTDEKTSFGFTMRYNKRGTKVQGSLLLIRHLADGTIYRIKSNALYGLALGESTDPAFGWASFSGKATYKEPDWIEPVGNYEFITYVEDWNEPGKGYDQFWIETYDKDRNTVLNMSMDLPASENTATLSGGNMAVPHS